MNAFCPNCETERPVRLIKTDETHEVRDVEVTVDVEYFECQECGADFDTPNTGDTLDEVYREYRKLKGMVQPEDVRSYRKRYGLTQHELARLLGWGLATLSRYENGALQDEAHDRALQMALEPTNLLKLLEHHPDAVAFDKREIIMGAIRSETTEESELLALIEANLGQHAPSEENGFRPFSSDKFFNAVLFFCRSEDGLTKTKLNKQLWYADMMHYKENAVSVTGTRYAHCSFGPAPDGFNLLFTYMVDGSGDLRNEDRVSGDFNWMVLVPEKDPDMNVFSQTELAALVQTHEFFKEYTASKIRDFSHEEEAYLSTVDGEIISYEFAKSLKV